MNFEITGSETGDQLIKQLVYLRHLARQYVQRIGRANKHRDEILSLQKERQGGAASDVITASLAAIDEQLLELRFAEIELGNYLLHLCPALDEKASRDAVFDAINTNKADRDTEDVRKYGDKTSHLIFVLDLENSASTRNDDWTEPLARPLKWCHTMAFMNAMQTNEKLDRAIHDDANEFFNGAFGEYRERPLMERLAGRAV